MKSRSLWRRYAFPICVGTAMSVIGGIEAVLVLNWIEVHHR